MIIKNKSKISFDYVLPDGTVVPSREISNKVQTEILTYCFKKIKSSDTECAKECDIVTQKVKLVNRSSALITNLFFKDEMTEGADYIEGSVIVNGIPRPAYSLEDGFYLPDIAPNSFVIVKYQIQINDSQVNKVQNYAQISYSVDDPIQGEVNFTENTNTVTIEIKKVILSVVKEVDKTSACKGDTLTYTSKITNDGTATANNLTFKDELSSALRFVEGSVKIDGISQGEYDPRDGFILPDIPAGECVIVTFKVQIK